MIFDSSYLAVYQSIYKIYSSLQSDGLRIGLKVHFISPESNRLMCQQRVLEEKRTSLSLSVRGRRHIGAQGV